MKDKYTFKAHVVSTNRAVLRAYAYALRMERKLDFDALEGFACPDRSEFQEALTRMPQALLVIDVFCGGGRFGEEERRLCAAVKEGMPKQCDNKLPEHAAKGWPCVALGYLVQAIDKKPDLEAAKSAFGWAMCGVLDSVQNGPRPELSAELMAMIEADVSRAPDAAKVKYKKGGLFSKREQTPEENLCSHDFGPLW